MESDTSSRKDHEKSLQQEELLTPQQSEPLQRGKLNSTIANSTTKSPGIRKAEVLNDQLDNVYLRVTLFFCVLCTSYAYAIESTVKGRLEAYATSSFEHHSLLSTVNVIRGVVAAAAQPTYARLSDRFGRLELIILSLLFYVVGTIVQSQSKTINAFAGGAVIYQIGFQGIIVMLQIILADFSTLNWRLTVSFIPALPFIINTWVSGDIVNSLYPSHSWNYCYGIWAFIFPLCCIPLICCFLYMRYKARKTEDWRIVCEEAAQTKKWVSIRENIVVDLFWELDVIGLLFIICIFGFILVPFTIAGGVKETWKKGSTIAPLVIGVVLVPCFVVYEKKYARSPVFPLPLLKDRGVWSALIIGVFINFVWYMPNEYMYSVLVFGMNNSIKAATRITQLYSFVSVIVGPLLGLIVVRVRRLKGFIIFGICCWIASLGILFHSRGADDGVNSEKQINGIIGALCLMGFGAGFFTYSTQVSIASCTNHEFMSIVISIYLASYNIGTALGSSVSGAVWTNKLYTRLLSEYTKSGLSNAEELATAAFSDPAGFIETYLWGTPERIPMVQAYSHVQKILCLVGLILTFPLLLDSFFLRDHRLDPVQSLELEHDNEGIRDEKGEIIVNNYDDDIIFKKIKSIFTRK